MITYVFTCGHRSQNPARMDNNHSRGQCLGTPQFYQPCSKYRPEYEAGDFLAVRMDLYERTLEGGIDLRNSVGMDQAREVIRRALKEQDRDTRHACADAILQEKYGIAGEEGKNGLIFKTRAQEACMNTQAV